MRSFAAIATFAALAFSAVTSAIPTGGPSVTDLGGNLIDTDVIIQNLNTNIEKSANPQINALNFGGSQSNNQARDLAELIHLPRGADGYKGIPNVLVDVNAEIGVLVKGLTAKLTAEIDAKVALSLAIDVLAKVKVILGGAVVKLEAIVGGDLNLALCLDGVVVEIQAVVELVATLLNTILLVVALVLKVCASIDVKAFLDVVVEVSAVLAVVIGLVAKVVVNISVLLGPLITIIAKLCLNLKLTALVQILGLHL